MKYRLKISQGSYDEFDIWFEGDESVVNTLIQDTLYTLREAYGTQSAGAVQTRPSLKPTSTSKVKGDM